MRLTDNRIEKYDIICKDKLVIPLQQIKNESDIYRFQCRNNHEFTASLNNIKRGSGLCAKCPKKHNINTIIQYAISKEGELIDKDKPYKYKEKYNFKCKEGHIFLKKWEGPCTTWCNICTKKERNSKKVKSTTGSKCEKCKEVTPSYNYEGQPSRYCKECKTDDMIDVRSKKCIKCKRPRHSKYASRVKKIYGHRI